MNKLIAVLLACSMLLLPACGSVATNDGGATTVNTTTTANTTAVNTTTANTTTVDGIDTTTAPDATTTDGVGESADATEVTPDTTEGETTTVTEATATTSTTVATTTKKPATTTKKPVVTTTKKPATTTTTTKKTTTTTAKPVVDPTRPDGVHNDVEFEIFRLLNEARAEQGLPALALATQYHHLAEIRAEECVESFSHIRPDGSHCFSVLGDDLSTVVFSAAENIAMGYSSAASVHYGWMNSSGHYANMMSTKVNAVAIAVAYSEHGTPYYVQFFVGIAD